MLNLLNLLCKILIYSNTSCLMDGHVFATKPTLSTSPWNDPNLLRTELLGAPGKDFAKSRKLQGFESKVLDEFAYAATQQGLARQRLASGQEVSVPHRFSCFWLSQAKQIHWVLDLQPSLCILPSAIINLSLCWMLGVSKGVARFIQPQGPISSLLSERQVPVFAHLKPE